MGNGWEMVAEYPTFVLRSGAFLAGALFFVKSLPLVMKSVFLYICYDKTSFCIIKRPDPGGFARLRAGVAKRGFCNF